MAEIEIVTAIVDSVDPDGRAGAVIVNMPGMDGGQYPLPVEPLWPAGEWICFPEPGDSVDVIMPAGDDIVEHPTDVRYIGKRRDADADPVPPEFKVHYPKRRGFKTKAGHLLIVDDQSGSEEITLIHKDGHMVSLTNTGIYFGTQGASEPMVLGELWKSMMDTIMGSYVNHTHPTGVGPSGVPSDASVWNTEKAKTGATISDFIFGQKAKP